MPSRFGYVRFAASDVLLLAVTRILVREAPSVLGPFGTSGGAGRGVRVSCVPTGSFVSDARGSKATLNPGSAAQGAGWKATFGSHGSALVLTATWAGTLAVAQPSRRRRELNEYES